MGSNDHVATPDGIISFWFDELEPRNWFAVSDDLDRQIERRFLKTHLKLAEEVGPEWRAAPSAWLAAIIVLDQFPRNIYRGTPHAFATDLLALREAKAAIAEGADNDVHARMKVFFYLPLEHSEVLADQDAAVRRISMLENPQYLEYALAHRAVVAEFGRFPHRNAILGRESTAAELEFLAKPGSGF